jgi:gamma-glutamyltranspeptidase
VLAADIRLDRAAAWGEGKGPGDTIWMGVIDQQGMAGSFIQSFYHEFGSGVVLAQTGINWQNRGASFSVDADKLLALKPGKKPFQRFAPAVVAELARRGHEVEVLLPFDETMGHAGAIVRHADGVLEGASDPRSDGAVAAW